ncbi:MAG: hypothetical protein ABIK83_07760 [Candidatus Zixiibacteriota bacterium]
MSNTSLRDREAKDILKKWGMRPTKLFRNSRTLGYWLRAQPPDGRDTGPVLTTPGAKLFSTQPDGLWLWFDCKLAFVDVIAVEVCRKDQNLNDKRSRYMPTNHALLIRCSAAWLGGSIALQKGGTIPRWKACGTLKKEHCIDRDIPVRHIRVLYALPDDLYDEWLSNVTPAAYEFFCRHTSVRSYTAKGYREFLNRMIPGAQFYTRPKT